MKESGVDCVSIANNHLRDYGNEGVEDTIKYCNQAGLDFVGGGMNEKEANRPLIRYIGEKKYAFLNYCEREYSIASTYKAGANPFNTIKAYYDIVSLRDQVDRIIVIYHGGLEYQHLPTPEMVMAFRYLIDVGADAVIAHHMHAYSGFEWYNGKPIYYGLGNFYFQLDGYNQDCWKKGLLLDASETGSKIKIEIYPTIMDHELTCVDLADDRASGIVKSHIEQINSLIEDSTGFVNYWSEEYSKRSEKILRAITARSKLHNRIIKLLGLKVKINPYARNILLNTVRCETHRAKMEAILEIEYMKGYRNSSKRE